MQTIVIKAGVDTVGKRMREDVRRGWEGDTRGWCGDVDTI